MTNWFYVDAKTRERVGPISESLIRAKFAAKEIGPQDLVWHAGLTDWMPAHKALSLAPVAGLSEGQNIPVPDGLRGWMTFVGLCAVLGGIFHIVTCVGVLAGVPMLLAGFAMMSARDLLDHAPYILPSQLAFFNKLAAVFRWLGWGIILMLGIVLLTALLFLISSAVYLPAHLEMMQSHFGSM